MLCRWRSTSTPSEASWVYPLVVRSGHRSAAWKHRQTGAQLLCAHGSSEWGQVGVRCNVTAAFYRVQGFYRYNMGRANWLAAIEFSKRRRTEQGQVMMALLYQTTCLQISRLVFLVSSVGYVTVSSLELGFVSCDLICLPPVADVKRKTFCHVSPVTCRRLCNTSMDPG